jgi:DNA adenine methylase
MSDRRVQSIAPWVGSNAQMVKQIIHQLGPHHAYWEVFLGGGSVLLAKEPCRQETVNDLHPELMNLIAVLASHRWSDLNDRLASTTFDERTFRDAVEYLSETFEPPIATATRVSNDQVTWAWATFVKWWMGKGGVAGGPREGELSIRYDSKGGSMPSRFRTACKSVVWLHQRLERVGIYNLDTFALLDRIEDRKGTVIYADPTFIGKDDLYTHSLTTAPDTSDDHDDLLRPTWRSKGVKLDDHARLAARLRRFDSTRVVLRYYAHPRLRDLYPDWGVVNCSRTKQIAPTSGGRRAASAPDLLLTNQCPYLMGDS